MQQENTRKQTDPMLSFHLMKFAFQDYHKSIHHLTDNEYSNVYTNANEEMLLHRVILTSEEACCVVIPESILDRTLLDVIAEYSSEEHFYGTLQKNNIPLTDYHAALHNDLRVETILSKVACKAQPVTSAEIQHYYISNKTDFLQPELRSGKHIQVTCDFSSKTETALALHQITTIHNKIRGNPGLFNKKAILSPEFDILPDITSFSKTSRGNLCQTLERQLCLLVSGEVSKVIKNSIGFNILHCTHIYPTKNITLNEATADIFATLLKEKQLNACRIWLQKIVQPPKTK